MTGGKILSSKKMEQKLIEFSFQTECSWDKRRRACWTLYNPFSFSMWNFVSPHNGSFVIED